MVIELRYFDDSGCDRCYCWKMSIKEAVGLTKWWENKGMQIRKRKLPVVEHKFGSVLISMFAQARVEARPIDRFGRPKFRAYSLPRAVIESLVASLEEVRPGSSEKESRKCSTRSS